MRPSRVLFAVLAGSVVAAAVPLHGQGYRVQLESRIQSVTVRGVQLDSVLAINVAPGPNGGLVSPAGFAVSCLPGAAYCSYYRPGPKRKGGPLVTSASFSVWDLGTPGLRLRGTGRLGVDVGDSDVWPGTEPAAQLVEGYLEYARPSFTVQAGRLHVASRFGYTGFDGGRAMARLFHGGLSASVYGGWGLGRGVALPVTSPALNPLDEFRPEERLIVLGGDVGGTLPWGSARLRYERRTDPDAEALVSERFGADAVFRFTPAVTLTGGADYDLASGWLGSAEGALGVAPPGARYMVTVGGRRYRPHFELWTIWGAFSPVPYHAGFARVTVTTMPALQLRAGAEVFEYEDPGTTTPLVDNEDGGWRLSVGGRYTHGRMLVADLEYHLDKGVGARSFGLDGSVTLFPMPDLTITGRVARLERALEFRFNDAELWLLGAGADWRAVDKIHAFASAAFIDETRDRDDAAGFSWNQVRLTGGLRVYFASGADRIDLPPAILRIPEGGER